ncbi:hypothetical protein [Acidianus sp. HS-5]|uniref:hypothetical protein n=1 Tax=Acidianus sp. HS-5 TaxID=2886040 RepID=UPI001F33F221|nr:hypothetical protein [Acidianus sp. HS-5]BDC17303.1 hypothetical protein HS5_01930 [Acidianus sp. HS-5]
MKNVIEPWGVNIPFLLLGFIYFAIGGISLISNPLAHGYFMFLGAYSLYEGMLLRLFFPAKKYLALQLATLVSLSIPLYPVVVTSFLFLTAVEIWGIRDVKSYGSKFPVNILVLSSPPISFISWLILPIKGYEVLIIPLLLYLLGINVGVFSANLNLKPKFGIKQIPIFLLVLLLYLDYKLFPLVIIAYFVWLFYGPKRVNKNSSALSTVLSSLSTSFSSYFLGETIHAFALGTMAPFFFSCITYSTSRYNYDKIYLVSALLALSYFFRFIIFPDSAVLFIASSAIFIYLIKDNFTFTTLKLGMSKKYLIKKLN